MEKLEIVFFGTSEFSATVLDSLLKKDFHISGIVTKPGSMADIATKHNIPIFSTAPTHGDLFAIASYGSILPMEAVQAPKFGTLNVHPSLLPKYRGASPIQTAILNGDSKTGVTIMLTDKKMDHGPILAQSEYSIDPNDTFTSLQDHLARLGGSLLAETIPVWIKGDINPKEQDHIKATYTKKLKRDDGRINWTVSAKHIERLVRAFSPWPSAWTKLGSRLIKITSAYAPAESVKNLEPGEIELISSSLFIGCGNGVLQIETLQPEGKQIMSGAEFARGYLKNKVTKFV
jgi:methionyl-tRNA formyltransferase